MKKLDEVTKSRIWLYGMLIGGIALVSLLINMHNVRYIRVSGVTLIPDRSVETLAQTPPDDLAVLAQHATEKRLFKADDILKALRQGKPVPARINSVDGADAPAYVWIVGAEENEAFLMVDQDGNPVDGKTVRLYRVFLP